MFLLLSTYKALVGLDSALGDGSALLDAKVVYKGKVPAVPVLRNRTLTLNIDKSQVILPACIIVPDTVTNSKSWVWMWTFLWHLMTDVRCTQVAAVNSESRALVCIRTTLTLN